MSANFSLDKLLNIKGISIEGKYSKSMSPVSYELKEITTRNEKTLFTDTLTRQYTHNLIGGYIAFDVISTQSLTLKTHFGYVSSTANDEIVISCSGSCSQRSSPVSTIKGFNAVADNQSLTGQGISLGLNLSYLFFKHAYGVIEFTRIKINYSAQKGEYGITYLGAGIGLTM